jgi:hypothetical protein
MPSSQSWSHLSASSDGSLSGEEGGSARSGGSGSGSPRGSPEMQLATESKENADGSGGGDIAPGDLKLPAPTAPKPVLACSPAIDVC